MEITYIYGNVLVIYSESTEMVEITHIWKISHKRRPYLIRLATNTSLLFPKNIISLFSLELSRSSSHFSKQQNSI